MPTFSVIVPAFNAEARVEETLRSIAGQTFGDFEAILVDDGSTDATRAILESWAARDARFYVVAQANSGPSQARNNAAVRCAKGRYLAFLDSDDLWAPSKLARSIEALKASPFANGVFGRIAFFRDRAEDSQTASAVRHGPLSLPALLGENPVCTTSNLVVERSLFIASGGFDTTMRYAEDFEWLVRVVAEGARIESVPETLVFYRASDNGLSVHLEKMHDGWLRAAKTARNHGAAILRSDLAAAEAVHLRYLARRALRINAPRGAALGFALRALRKSPAGFFADKRRGGLTLAAALAEALFPKPLRRLTASY